MTELQFKQTYDFRISSVKLNSIVAYLLKVRTVEAEKRPLLGNHPYTQQRNVSHILLGHATIEEVLHSLWVLITLFAMQLCG